MLINIIGTKNFTVKDELLNLVSSLSYEIEDDNILKAMEDEARAIVRHKNDKRAKEILEGVAFGLSELPAFTPRYKRQAELAELLKEALL